MKGEGFTTSIVHSDRRGDVEHRAIHKPVHQNVAYGYGETAALCHAFQTGGYTYGRQINPTVGALEAKITQMEGGLKTVCFSTGMAAIGTMMFALLRAGDHVVSSAFLFGNTNSLLRSFDERGVAIDFVDATSVDNVAQCLTERTRLVFVETIANPRTQVADLEAISALCADRGIVFVVDNTMTSPYLFRSVDIGASLVVNSLTKYIGGHGNALGGAVTELGNFDWQTYDNISPEYRSGNSSLWGLTQIKKKGLRDFGAALGPEAAHHIAIGSETLALRMRQQCANAAALTDYLQAHPKVARVHYPGLAEHPQHERAGRLFRLPGALFSFELDDALDVFAFLDALDVVIKSSNLGDNRTLAIPVAHTIYFEMGAQRRASMGISESLVRISVGIEDTTDLIADFERAFSSLEAK
ncbi:MAG: cystathionine gamma-synthase family protein [Pseudomonadaceae bacterium]|nr:cystathionine gamma-synthase family protein [Pseudomonadaceae bacterium]